MYQDNTATGVAMGEEANRLYRKIAWRILPVLFLSYCIAFLDRVNVGFTQLQMGQALGIGPAQYGFAAGIFFLSYALCEMPSNALFARLGARKTFLRIMLMWGLVVVATAFAKTPTQFYTLRVLLGIFEAGFFPGMILYLSYWFPSALRARATAAVALANALAATIAGPLTASIMAGFDGAMGMQGWQWVFIIQGFPACVLGVVCYFALADSPQDAKWLSREEKRYLSDLLKADSASADASKGSILAMFKDPAIYLLVVLYFCSTAANYLFNFWLPTMIRETGVANIMDIGLLTMIPMVAGCIGLIILNWSSDVFKERRFHLAAGYALASVGLLASTWFHDSVTFMIATFCLANLGIMAVFPLFWTLPPTYLRPQNAPLGIAFISMLGITAGFVSPYLFGLVKSATGSLTVGIYILSGLLALCVLLILKVLPERALRVGKAG